VPLAEAGDTRVIGDQRAGARDGRGDRQPVRRITVGEIMPPIGACGGAAVERRGRDAGPIEKALDPPLDRNVEFDPPGIDEERDLPGRDGAEQDGPAALPAPVDRRMGRRAQMAVAAVAPQRDATARASPRRQAVLWYGAAARKEPLMSCRPR
jgi:hypothetical protein